MLPLPTGADAAALRDDLASFTADAAAGVLGPRATAALDREQLEPARMALEALPPEISSGQARLIHQIRLFVLGQRLTPGEIDLALPRSAAALRRLGLLPGGEAAIEIQAVTIGGRDLLIASDLGEARTGAPVRPEHVLGVGGAAATLAQLTVRAPVRRALDLGTGSGIQALGLATHAGHVVATDISERALGFAALSLALSGLSDPAAIELRQGSMLEPVAGEQFDLIVSNPPFVISPRTGVLPTYIYRDGGAQGDSLLAGLIAALPSALAPGGTAQLLGSWEIHSGDWTERVRAWVQATGLDAWVIQREQLDPAQYVETWLRDGGLTPERDPAGWATACRGWLQDLDARGVRAVGFGHLTLHRPAQPRSPAIRLEQITGTVSPTLGPVIAAAVAMQDLLADTDDDALARWHVTVAEDVTEERHHRPGAADPSIIILRQGGGLARAVQADTVLAAAVGCCDGELGIGEICAAVATALGAEEAAVRRQVLPQLRGLLIDGLLEADPATLGA